jgi:hypothetical protein
MHSIGLFPIGDAEIEHENEECTTRRRAAATSVFLLEAKLPSAPSGPLSPLAAPSRSVPVWRRAIADPPRHEAADPGESPDDRMMQ